MFKELRQAERRSRKIKGTIELKYETISQDIISLNDTAGAPIPEETLGDIDMGSEHMDNSTLFSGNKTAKNADYSTI